MSVLDLVRRAASGRMSDARLARAAAALDGDWRAAEQAVAASLAVSPRKAARDVEAFARVAAASGVREARGRAARLRASLLTYLSRPAESRRAYREAIRLLDGAARDGARIGLAAAESRLGRFEAARALCRAARRDARRRGDALLAAAADANEGFALHESGRSKAALPFLRRAREGAAAHPQIAASATTNLANALVNLDRPAEASPLLAEAAQAFAALGQSFESARCLHNAGALAAAMDRLGEADLSLQDAEERFLAAGDAVQAALVRVDRGETMLRAGLVPEAVRLLDSARRGLGRGAPPGERVRAVRLRARAALASGDAAAARRLASAPVPRGLRGTEADRDEIAGRALALEGRPDAARARLLRAAGAFGAARPAARARCLAAAAWCALDQGDAQAARRLAARASRSAAGLPGVLFAAEATSFLAEHRSGRADAADAALDRSIAALELVRAGLGHDAMRAALLTGREPWLAAAVRHVLERRGADAALALVERFRARALIDLLGAADEAAPRNERVARLRARVALLERDAAGATPGGFLRSGAAPAASTLRAAERALAEAFVVVAPHRDAADLRAVRASLPEDTLTLSLFGDGDATHLFTMDAGGVTSRVAHVGSARVAALVEELRYAIGKFALGDDYAARHGERLARETDRVLAALAEIAIAPVANEIARARRLVVVPHGPWHLVPFAALPLRGRRLVEACDVSLAPSLGALAGEVGRGRGAPLVLSAPDALAPTMGDEGRAVAAALREALLHEGDDARFGALVSALEPECVHVAAHGRFRPDAPAMGGVRLADGWVRAIDFASLRLPGSLVVLSGCETGVSGVGPGDEVHGLVRGVLASGAAELVASLWRVGDADAASLMAAFHRARAGGATTVAALGATQRDAIARGVPVWSWAAFALWTRRARD